MFSKPVSWSRSLLAATIVTYAPFVLLVCFMLAFERQWGNTLSAIGLLPFAPAVLPAALTGEIVPTLLRFDLPKLAEQVLVWTMTAAFIIAVASLGRLGREWLVGGAVAAFFLNGMAAYWLWHAIRM